VNPFSVSGKLALITGAASGIGFAAAKVLAESGANLILSGRRLSELEKAAQTLANFTSRVHVAPFDLNQISNISGWFEQVGHHTGVPDILINSAGITRRGMAVDLQLADWNEVLAVSATAIFELSRCFARIRIAQGGGGRIVNLASLMTAAARPGTSAYTASKGALGQLTKVLAVQWAKYGIRVNAIAPGYIDTSLNRDLVSGPEFNSWVIGRCPMGRWGTPEDVAWPIVFLSSPAAEFMTGQVVFVDRGWLATF
jgi:gluconate 5-dehydrogenase